MLLVLGLVPVLGLVAASVMALVLVLWPVLATFTISLLLSRRARGLECLLVLRSMVVLELGSIPLPIVMGGLGGPFIRLIELVSTPLPIVMGGPFILLEGPSTLHLSLNLSHALVLPSSRML